MRGAFRRIGIAAALLLSACAPSDRAFDRAAVPTSKMVIVLPAGHPDSFSSFDTSWGFLGLVGDFIGQDTVHTTASAPADAADEFSLQLETALRAAGWTVRAGPRLPRRTQTELADDYRSFANSDGTLVLDSAITQAGYIAAPLRAFRPNVWVSARLVDPASGKVLYFKRILYGVNPLGAATYIGDAEERYYFRSAADLRAHPDEAVAGLRAGLVRIANAIAQDLKSP